MPVNFSDEIIIANCFREYLRCHEWEICQLVCSGGQAHMSISYTVNDRRKTVFPDVIAIKNNTILIGEIKGRFNESDKLKLLEIYVSSLAQDRLKKNISLRFNLIAEELEIKYALIHGQLDSMADPFVYQYKFNGLSFEICLPDSGVR